MKKKKRIENNKTTVGKVVKKQTEDKEITKVEDESKENVSFGGNNNVSIPVVIENESTNSKKGTFPYKDVFVILLALIILASNVMVLVSVGKFGKKIDNIGSTSSTSGTDMTNQTTENSQFQSQSQEQPSSSEAPTNPSEEPTSEPPSSEEPTSGDNVGDVDEKVVYLTFDDGPSVCTKVILDILDDYDVKATFFIVKPSDSYLPVLNEIVKRGHTLAIHSYTHEYEKIYKNFDAFVKDVTSIRNLVFEQTGYLPTIYRFPGGSSCKIGDLNRKEAIKYLYSQGMVHFDWNVSADDSVSAYITKEEVIENVYRDIGKSNNSVVLMHDTSSKVSTVAALPELIERLKADGYVFKKIDENTTPVQQIKVKVTLPEVDESDEVIIEATTPANTQPAEGESEDIMEE